MVNVIASIEKDANTTTEKYRLENETQQSSLVQVNVANNVLGGNAELLSLGMSIDGMTTRLFIASSNDEIGRIRQELIKIFELLESVKKNLEKAMKKLGANEEMKMLQDAEGSLISTKGLLLEENGVIDKLSHNLIMQEKAKQATDKLRNIVLKQAE